MSADPLVQFLEHRDQASFAELVARCRDDVLRAAYRVLGDSVAAEDVAQDVFLRCLNPPWEASEVRDGRALLAATAINLARMEIRASVRRRGREATAHERRESDDEGLGREAIEHVRFAVDELPEELRRPVELRYFGGLPLVDLARALDCSLSTAKARLQQARTMLRRRLADARYGVVLAFVAGDAPGPGIADPTPTAGFVQGLDRLAREGVACSRIAREGGRGIRPRGRLIQAALLAVVLGAAALTAWFGAGAVGDGAAGGAGNGPAETADAGGSGPDGRGARRHVASPGDAAGDADASPSDPASPGADDGAPAMPAPDGGIALTVEVVDEAGNAVRSGTSQLPLTDFPDLDPTERPAAWDDLMERLEAWEWALDPYDLADGNPRVLEGVPDGADGLALEASAEVPGFAPARPRAVTLRRGEHAHVRLVVVPESEARVEVVDAASGLPVAGASVLFLSELDRRGVDEDAPPPAPSPGVGTTGGDGVAIVGGLGEWPHEIEVRAGGHVARVLDAAPRGETTVVRVRALEGAGSIVVEVRTPDGRPAEGQRVELDVEGRSTDEVARVDATGFCRFDGVPPGHHSLLLDIEDWIEIAGRSGGTTETTALTEHVDLGPGAEVRVRLGHLAAAAPLTVTVVGDDGRPRAGAEVSIFGPVLLEGETGDDGRAVFPGLPEGSYSVHLGGATDWTVANDVAIAPGAPGAVRVVAGERTIRGRVLLAGTDAPARGAMLFVTADDGANVMAWTDAAGRFEVGGARAGRVELQCASGGDLVTAVVKIEVRRDADPDPLEVRLLRGGRLRIRAPADPLATYRVLLPDDGDRVAEPGDAGDPEIRGLAVGTHELEVVRDGVVVARRTFEVRAGECTELDLGE